MTLEELEREVTRLEDIHAIKDLQCKYGYYMDSHRRQEVYDLFSDDTESVEIESTGLFLGKKGVAKFFLDNDLLEPGQTVALVAHTLVNRVLICAALGLGNDYYWRFDQDTCAINLLQWDGARFVLTLLNDTSHLWRAAEP